MSAYGILFHHFHDDQHPRGQGSISASDLVEWIDHIGRDKILPPNEWMRRALKLNGMQLKPQRRHSSAIRRITDEF